MPEVAKRKVRSLLEVPYQRLESELFRYCVASSDFDHVKAEVKDAPLEKRRSSCACIE